MSSQVDDAASAPAKDPVAGKAPDANPGLEDERCNPASEAFHRIRKASMDNRKSMREIAEAILLTHQLEKST